MRSASVVVIRESKSAVESRERARGPLDGEAIEERERARARRAHVVVLLACWRLTLMPRCCPRSRSPRAPRRCRCRRSAAARAGGRAPRRREALEVSANGSRILGSAESHSPLLFRESAVGSTPPKSTPSDPCPQAESASAHAVHVSILPSVGAFPPLLAPPYAPMRRRATPGICT